MNNIWSNDFNAFAAEVERDNSVVDKIFEEADSLLKGKIKDVYINVIAISPVVMNLCEGLKNDEKLRIVFSPETIQKLKDGTYKMMETASGELKAVAVDKNGKIREIGALTLDDVIKGVNPTQLFMAIQGAQLQKEMQEIKKELQDLSEALESVRGGLHSDRIAKYYSAENLYLESRLAKDEKRKEELFLQCIVRLNDAIAEMGLSLKNNIEEANGLFEKNKGKSNSKTDKIVSEINELFEVIHKAYMLKTGIYYSQGEIDSMAMSLVQYKTCIINLTSNKLIMDKIYMLDKNKKKLEEGLGYKAEKIPLIIDENLKKIGCPNEYLIEFPKEIAV